MNLLEMLIRLHSESSRQGAAPTSVTGNTGKNLSLLNWIKTSYEDIQLLHETWRFRRDEFSGSTVALTQDYTPADFSITDLSQWWVDIRPGNLSGIRIYSSEADETDLQFIPWDDFRRFYKYGARRSQSERPTVFSIKPDNKMALWPVPNAIYTVNGEYVKQPDTMTDATDEPIFSDFHMAIVWKALMYYGADAGANDVYHHGQNQYTDLIFQMEHAYLPKVQYGPPLI